MKGIKLVEQENPSATSSPSTVKGPRQALTPVQRTNMVGSTTGDKKKVMSSSQKKSSVKENIAVKEKVTETTVMKRGSPLLTKAKFFTSTPIRQKTAQDIKILEDKTEAVGKEETLDKETQTTFEDEDFLTSDEPSLGYWRTLAETRRKALEDALKENEILSNRIEELEEDNRALEEMVQQAKELATLVSEITEDSGITADQSSSLAKDESDDES